MTAMTSSPVDPSNEAAALAWDGQEGAFWAANADRFDRSIAGYHDRLLLAAAPRPADRVLDLGCGTGQTTRDAARLASAGSALGVDLSSQMLDVARSLSAAKGIANATFERADAQVHPFAPASFDVVLSRTGTMFFGDADAAFANVARAMRPAGRLAILVWQGPGPNEWLRELRGALLAGRDLPAPPLGVPGPFAFADPSRATAVLEGAGFVDVVVEDVRAPMWFGTDPDDGLEFVLGVMGWMLDGLEVDRREAAVRALRDVLSDHQTPDGVLLGSGAWLVTAVRREEQS
jgi:SAM-dependent methyltransferase